MSEDIVFEVQCKIKLTGSKAEYYIFDLFCDYLGTLNLCFGGSLSNTGIDGIVGSDTEGVPSTEFDREVVKLFLNKLEGTSSVVVGELVDFNTTTTKTQVKEIQESLEAYREDLEK